MRTERDDDLAAALRDAIRRSVAEFEATHPGDAIVGYALLTDDEVMTASDAAISTRAMGGAPDEELLWSPTDWPHQFERPEFEAISGMLARLATGRGLRKHVEASFALLVEALRSSRASGVLGADVFLSVLSTDPSPHLERLEDASVERLNDAAIVRRRQAWIASLGLGED